MASIKELIQAAMKESPEFEFKYLYWTEQRRKTPDLDWLMSNLQEVLGVEYVREAAKKHIEDQKST
jgi:hypothetical protein